MKVKYIFIIFIISLTQHMFNLTSSYNFIGQLDQFDDFNCVTNSFAQPHGA